jgi:hypothetical protein
MRLLKAQQFLTWAILVYFAAFIIPPVSSFSSSVRSGIVRVDQFSMEQDHRQTRLYLVDILLWLSLKQSRHSDKLMVAPQEQTAVSPWNGMADPVTASVPLHQTHFARSDRRLHHTISGNLSRSSELVYTRSGISPPNLL